MVWCHPPPWHDESELGNHHVSSQVFHRHARPKRPVSWMCHPPTGGDTPCYRWDSVGVFPLFSGRRAIGSGRFQAPKTTFVYQQFFMYACMYLATVCEIEQQQETEEEQEEQKRSGTMKSERLLKKRPNLHFLRLLQQKWVGKGKQTICPRSKNGDLPKVKKKSKFKKCPLPFPSVPAWRYKFSSAPQLQTKPLKQERQIQWLDTNCKYLHSGTNHNMFKENM